MVPEWLQWAIPCASGAAGVLVTLKVGMAKLESTVYHLRDQVEENKETLKDQVGEERCLRMRDDCQTRIDKRLDELHTAVEANRVYVSSKFENVAVELKAIAIWMAKHNGDP